MSRCDGNLIVAAFIKSHRLMIEEAKKATKHGWNFTTPNGNEMSASSALELLKWYDKQLKAIGVIS